MVLRDTYINNTVRSLTFLLLLFAGACRQSSSDAASSEATPTEKDASSSRTVLTDHIQVIRDELKPALQAINATFSEASSRRLSSGEKDADKETVEAVFEKSAATLGGLFILNGSLDAVEKRFKEGILDKKQADEMLVKLRGDIKSYQADIANYQEMLNSTAPARNTEKK